MNRAARRAAAKVRHELRKANGMERAASPFNLGVDQDMWLCSCGSGWITITSGDPVEAHEAHVAGALGVAV